MKSIKRLISKKNQSGLATLEALPILMVFIVLFTYGLGLFGSVHTAILHSIHARTYAFETLRNRTNYVYFRDADPINGGRPGELQHYGELGFRLHGIDSDSEPNSGDIVATTRQITFGRRADARNADVADVHNNRIFQLGRQRNREGGVEVNPVWIMVQYGICLNANCGR